MNNYQFRQPVFVHSLFRSGSTYIFHAFRRAGSKYFCYHEPIHEIVLSAKDTPENLLLLSGKGEEQQELRHPEMDLPYFDELYRTHPKWCDKIVNDIIYADYFGMHAFDQTAEYLNVLIEAAKGRPIINECRTTLRISPLKERLGGLHILLWRNPWDQWWSNKTTDYFDTANQIILNTPSHPEVISILKQAISFQKCDKEDVMEQLDFYKRRRPSVDDSYLTFFTLWCLTLIEGIRSADLMINIDKLSSSKNYRKSILEQLSEHGLNDIDFSDCCAPCSTYGEKDQRFFRPHEKMVKAWLTQTAFAEEEIDKIQTLREAQAPKTKGKSNAKNLLQSLEILREVTRRIESREADNSRLALEDHQTFQAEQEAIAKRLQTEVKVAKARIEELTDDFTTTKANAEKDEAIAKRLQTEVDAAKARIEELNDELTTTKTNAEQDEAIAKRLQTEVEADKARIEELDVELTTTKANAVQDKAIAKRLQTEVEAAKARLEELTDELITTKANVEQLNAQLSEKYDALAYREADLKEEKVRTKWMQTEWDTTKARTEELAVELTMTKNSVVALQSKLSESKLHADSLQAGLDLAFASLSWRITAPLRHGKTYLKTFLRRSFYVARCILLKPIEVLRAIGTWAANKPMLKRCVDKILPLHSKLRWRITIFLRNNPKKDAEAINLSVMDTTFVETKSRSSHTEVQERTIYYWIDHTVQCNTNTGVQRVTRCLAKELLEEGENVVFVKWDASTQGLTLANQKELHWLSRWNGPQFTIDILNKYPSDDKTLVSIPSSSRKQATKKDWLFVPEVTYITNQTTPPTLDAILSARKLGLMVAFIFYDAIPLKLDEYSSSAKKHEDYMQQIVLSDLLIPISVHSGNDLLSYSKNRLWFQPNTLPKIKPILLAGEIYDSQRIRNIDTDYTSYTILCVGTIEHRKNQTTLIKAFNKICSNYNDLPLRLVFVGNLHHSIQPILDEAIKTNPKIEYMKYLSDKELKKLYGDCIFTVFPSYEEGFGLPIIESLWHGKPCICANFGSMAEIAADGGCLTVDTMSVDKLEEAMEQLLFDHEIRSKISSDIYSRPIKTWKQYANECRDALDRVTSPVEKIGAIYYWVDHTCTYPSNSGIQRVVRGTAKALIDTGINLIPVRWNSDTSELYPVTREDLLHLEKWNGPAADSWASWQAPSGSSNWMLLPELTTYSNQIKLDEVVLYSKKMSMKTAVIFFDVIPYKMSDIYSIEAGKAHLEYMKSLLQFDKVMAISKYSANELVAVLRREADRIVNLHDKVKGVPLPGEFTESKRIEIIDKKDDSILHIFCAGTVEPRKNHRVLLEAFERVLKKTKRNVELTIAGNDPFPELKQLVEKFCRNHKNVRWIVDADDYEFKILYSKSHFTVFPTLEEGFGLPILESLWHACPCICRNASAMAEVSEEGGCLAIDTSDPEELANAMLRLIEDDEYRLLLTKEAVARKFKTWKQYAIDILKEMVADYPGSVQLKENDFQKTHTDNSKDLFCLKNKSPLLSICITTFNRAEWLSISLKNLFRFESSFNNEIEIIVCDNTSTDHTTEVVQPYLEKKNFQYYRNEKNVGMLGNLRVTAHNAKGKYVWILGDDDLLKNGAIEQVLRVINKYPDVGLIYLNYAYTRIAEANKVVDLDDFIADATPIVPPGPDKYSKIKEIATLSENFFTAIYCLVFRRDHALRAYSQNTEGRPFSTMITCIPTSYYVMNYMAEEDGYWIGEPSLVVNMNVSWGKYAPLWILERIPELYDLAEKMGANPEDMDRWRKHNLPGLMHYFRTIFDDDPEGNLAYFSMDRMLMRYKHLDDFKANIVKIINIYIDGVKRGKIASKEDPTILIKKYGIYAN